MRPPGESRRFAVSVAFSHLVCTPVHSQLRCTNTLANAPRRPPCGAAVRALGSKKCKPHNRVRVCERSESAIRYTRRLWRSATVVPTDGCHLSSRRGLACRFARGTHSLLASTARRCAPLYLRRYCRRCCHSASAATCLSLRSAASVHPPVRPRPTRRAPPLSATSPSPVPRAPRAPT